MELIRAAKAPVFSNSGVTSKQLLFPENSKSDRITITRVVIEPGAVNPPHSHETSEQVWIALQGSGQLLLAEGDELHFEQGDVVRFEDGDIHGFKNTGKVAFEYLSVTSPPLNFRASYDKQWGEGVSKEVEPGAPADAPRPADSSGG